MTLRLKALLLCSTAAIVVGAASAQDYVQKTPTADQTVTQPSGTSLIINNLTTTYGANFMNNVGIGATASDQKLTVTGPEATIVAINTDPYITTSGNSADGTERSYFGTFPTLFQFSYNRLPATGYIPNPLQSAAYINVNGGTGPAGFDVVLQEAPGSANFPNVLHASGTGNVGIGTTSPASRLEVNGNLTLTQGSSSGIVFPDGSLQTVAYPGTSGSLGVGVSNPDQALVVGGHYATIEASNTQGDGTVQKSFFGTYDHLFQFAYNRLPSNGLIPNPSDSAAYINVSGGSGPAAFDVVLEAGPNTDFKNVMHASGNGNVGIGTIHPGEALTVDNQPYSPPGPVFEVSGTVALTYHAGGAMVFQDGTVQSTAWNGTTSGGDYAESVDVIGARDTYEPGDVIVIDPSETGKFSKSFSPYSRLVAGVYSTKPGLVGRRTTADRPDKKAEVPMAMLGIVPVKVSTENGPIERGDLLVSSSTPGVAMKGTDRDRLTGAVIGKALGSLRSGDGVLETLLAVQ